MDIKRKLGQELESLQGVKVETITVETWQNGQLLTAIVEIEEFGEMEFTFRGKTIGDILQNVERFINHWGSKKNAR